MQDNARRMLFRFGLALALFVVFLFLTGGWLRYRLLDVVENFTYDTRVRINEPRDRDDRVVIVDIDEKSMAAEGQFPWPRAKVAHLVTQLFDVYHVRAAGFDITFPEPDNNSPARVLKALSASAVAQLPGFQAAVDSEGSKFDYDQTLAEAIKGKPVVLGYYFSFNGDATTSRGGLCAPLMDKTAAGLYGIDYFKPTSYTGNLTVLQDATAYCGFFDNPALDEDGVYRRVPLVQLYEGQIYPSLALQLTRVALGSPPPPLQFEFDPPEARGALNLEKVRVGPVAAAVDGHAAAMVPYRGPERSFPYVSATDVLSGKADAKVLQGRVVLVGTSAPGLRDLRVTPVSQAYSGVEIHANLISGMLSGNIKQKAPYYSGIETTLLFLVAMILAFGFSRMSPVGSALLTLGVLGVIVVLALWLWQSANFIMPMGVPIVFTLAAFIAQLIYGYFIESRGKREISKLFGQYVPPELVEEMAEHPEAISMEGESREMSVLFSDVRGFTSISETLDAKELAQLMNLFLTKQTGVIQKHRGTIDKYMGDAVMAFWGAPLADKDHAMNAVVAGMEMVKAVRELDDEFAKRGWPKLNIGVGINTGKMNVGNMGSEFRMAYTVMGDAVNLGSRVEGLTKEYGVTIIVTQFTRDQLPSEWAFRELDLVRVKGKNEPVAIYEPMGPKDALDPGLRQDLARQRGALKLYRAQSWDQAEQEFFTLKTSGRDHPVYDLFLERILFLRENPPGKDWDGAFTFKTK